MLKTLYVPEVSWRQLPPMLCLSLGALLGLVLAGFVLGGRYAQQQSLLLEEYGTGMARLVANTSVDAALGRDLISLHALLREATQESRVMMATVHDVDNVLLVQAGQLESGLSNETFVAEITVDENLVGSISLTLAQGFAGDAAVRWTLLGTGALLLLMVLLAVYESYGSAWQWRIVSRPTEDSEAGYDEEPFDADAFGFSMPFTQNDQSAGSADSFPEQSPAVTADFEPPSRSAATDDLAHDEALHEASAVGPEPERAVNPEDAPSLREGAKPQSLRQNNLQKSDLIVVLPNCKRLQQQLASDRFNHLIEAFEMRLGEVLTLYGGARVGQASEGIYCARFSSTESFAEAAFRALCSAYLLQSLGEGDRVRFQMLAQVCAPDADIKLAVNDVGIYLHAGVDDQLLCARLQLEPTDDGRLRLTGFEGSYAALLQRQQQQLLVLGRGQFAEPTQF